MVKKDKENPLSKHDKDYNPDAWMDYDEDEYLYWIRLLTKRATMRTNTDKMKKDLYDAKNYMWMLEQYLEFILKEE